MNGVLRTNALFEGMSDDEISQALRFYDAKRVAYHKGETVLPISSPVERFALVLSGCVQVMTDDYNGLTVIMLTVEKGQTFAESLCFRRVRESPVYARAVTGCEILWLSLAGLSREGGLAHCQRFIGLLTQKTLAMNDRIQALSKLTLRDKLNTLFSQYAQKNGAEFDIPMDRDALAAYLGANRSALSRELSKMRSEGIIEFTKNHFTLTGK